MAKAAHQSRSSRAAHEPPELTGNEDVAVELRAVFRYDLQTAIGKLQTGGDSIDIHGARKQLKHARAILRLLREALGELPYHRANSALRDVARPLSEARDAEVLVAALDALMKRYDSATASLHLSRFCRLLVRERGQRRAAITRPAALSVVRDELNRVRRSTDRWRLAGKDWQAIAPALVHTYRGGRKALRTAHRDPSAANLHEWRKQAKYLWHQLQILEPLSPRDSGETADDLHRLSDYLGDEHDLVVLKEKATAGNREIDESTCAALTALIQRRREKLQAKAFALGRGLYASKAKRFEKCFTQRQEAWLAHRH
jgi:CHAD domain-containing protein